MCNEPQLNPELENFEDALRQFAVPQANVDRDQLMYDAGWAAAMANRKPEVAVPGRGFTSLAMSFAGGVAVAAAVLLSVVPLNQEVDRGAIANNGVALLDAEKTDEPAGSAISVASSNEEETDLLAWIENLPPGQSINSGFSTSPTNPALANFDSSSQQLANQKPYRPKTSGQLLSELIPGVAARPATPAWSAWLMP